MTQESIVERTDWLFFNEAMKADWCQKTAELLKIVLAVKDVEVQLRLPTKVDAEKAFKCNMDLLGTLYLKLDGVEIGTLNIPLPFEGVFLRQRRENFVVDEVFTALPMVWHSWLGEQPGFRLVKSLDGETIHWRVGLLGGNFVEGDKDKELMVVEKCLPSRLTRKKGKVIEDVPSIISRLGKKYGYPDWLTDISKGGKTWSDVHEYVLKEFRGRLDCVDAESLEHRMLFTFPVWLRIRLCRILLNEYADDIIAREERLQELRQKLERSLVPIRPYKRGNDESKYQMLVYVDPNNPVDLLARLTHVSRYMFGRSRLEHFSAAIRQNHDSFKGCLCPVESPESELVGLSLQLASDSTVDSEGGIHPAAPVDGCYRGCLGLGAALIPFAQYNDGVRLMMGAKNLRQALPIQGREASRICTGGETRIVGMTKDLVDIGICPDCCDNGKLALGRDLLVAYMPWYGWNIDDAVVIGRHVVTEGWFTVARTKRKRFHINSNWRIKERKSDGEYLNDGDVVLELQHSRDSKKKYSIRHHGVKVKLLLIQTKLPRVDDGIDLLDASVSTRHCISSYVLDYVVEEEIPLDVGDKLMGRHGNKGVVGRIEDEDNMPRLPNDKRLPEEFRGQKIDIILNPHGVISRMNLGQLLETHVGWLLHNQVDITKLLKTGKRGDMDIGRPDVNLLDHDTIQSSLVDKGLDDLGRVALEWEKDGQTCKSMAVVGYEHIVRLCHIPSFKAQARKGGEDSDFYNRKTGQAAHGRNVGGGQRLGEMEVWALEAYRADYILEEMLGVKSDRLWARSLARMSKDNIGEPMSVPPGEPFSGFPHLFRDWLFALLIDLKMELGQNGEQRLSLSLIKGEDAIKARCVGKIDCVGKRKTAGKVKSVDIAQFKCPSCAYSFSEGPFRVGSDGGGLRSKCLTLDSLLQGMGLRIVGKVEQGRKCSNHTYFGFIKVEAVPGTNLDVCESRVHVLRIYGVTSKPRSGQDPDTLILCLTPEGTLPKRWPAGHKSLYCKSRYSHGTVRISVDEIWDSLTFEEGKLGIFHVICENHKSKELRPEDVEEGHAGGDLWDFGIFGSDRFPSPSDKFPSPSKERWGYIELPESVPYPADVFYGEDNKDEDERLTMEFPEISIVPVLPFHYRNFMPGDRVRYRDDIFDKGYTPLLVECKKEHPSKDRISRCVTNLFKLLVKELDGKMGILRRSGLGRRVDRSARLVITPDPTLPWNVVGVPSGVLEKLSGTPLTLKNELLVINRQPSLHRDSMRAVHPVPYPLERGTTLRISPLICEGFGADFDGDEMVMHYPISTHAQEDALKLLPERNLFSLATKKPIVSYSQDFVMGSYLNSWCLIEAFDKVGKEIQDSADPERGEFSALAESLDSKMMSLDKIELERLRRKCAEEIINGLSKENGLTIFKWLFNGGNRRETVLKLVGRWMEFALKSCTENNVTFGFYDFMEINKLVKKMGAVQTLDQILDGLSANADLLKAGVMVAKMVKSKARGDAQIGQLVSCRGRLDGMDENTRIDKALVLGMNWDDAFNAAKNSRSSMCDKKLNTAKAGALTRRLVMLLQSQVIVCEDCGETNHSIVTCKAVGGICQKCYCYGELPSATLPQVGWPIGLIAAQSIGERGTQLSMQSFHGSARQTKSFSMINETIRNANSLDLETFIKKFKDGDKTKDSPSPYSEIDERHFQLLWRVIRQAGGVNDSLDRVKEIDMFAWMLSAKPMQRLLDLARDSESISIKKDIWQPIARTLFNLWGTRAGELARENTGK